MKGSTSVQHAFWEEIFERLKILPLDEDCAKVAAQLHRNLVLRNKIIDLPDLLIASIAISNDLPIATLNKKDFERITQLKIVSQ